MNPNAETPRDLQEEITELEYFASERELSTLEAARLAELQGQRGTIRAAAYEEVATADPVVNGDDSP